MSEADGYLARVPLFEKLDEAELEQLTRLVETDGRLAGTLIFERGDPPDAFYVIARGRVEIVLDDGERVELGEGDFFGEMGVMNSATRSADAVAAEDTVLLRISKEDFDRVLTLDETIAAKVMKACLERGKRMAVLAEGAAEDAAPAHEVVAVYSPRGGAGTTTLAVNLACCLADLSGARVGLLDADLQFGNCHMLLPTEGPPRGIAEVVAGLGDRELDAESLGAMVEETERSLDLVRTPKKTEEADLVTAAHLVQVLDGLAARCGTVVVDCPTPLAEKTLAVLERATSVLLVVEPELVSMHRALDCMRLFELVGIDAAKVKPVVNQAGKGGIPVEEIEQLLKGRLYASLSRDAEGAGAAIHEGVPVVDRDRSSRLAIDLRNLARRYLNPFDPLLETNAEAKKKAGFSLWDFFLGDDGEGAAPGARA